MGGDRAVPTSDTVSDESRRANHWRGPVFQIRWGGLIQREDIYSHSTADREIRQGLPVFSFIFDPVRWLPVEIQLNRDAIMSLMLS